MAKSIICNFGTIGCVDNATYYTPIAGSIRFDASVHTTEAYVQIPVKTAGNFRELRFYVTANDCTNAVTVTLRKNGAGTALTKSVSAGATGWQAVVADVACSSGDFWAVEIVVPGEAGTHTITITSTVLMYEPTDSSKTIQIFANAGDNPGLSTDSATRFMSANGVCQYSLIEANNKFRFRTSCSVENLYAYAISNARTTDTVVSVRKNGGAGSASLTFGSGVSGALTPSASTDSFTAGDDFNPQIVTSTGGGSIVLSVVSVEVISTDNTFPMCCALGNGVTIGPSTTRYYGPHGGREFATATQAEAQIKSPLGFTVQEAHIMVTTNTCATTGGTVNAQSAGSDSILEIAIPILTTGLLNENVVVGIVTDDFLNWRITNGDAAGSISSNWIGLLCTVPPAGGGAVPVIENLYRQQRG